MQIQTKRKKGRSLSVTLHKYFGVAIGFILIYMSISGILLNHPNITGKINTPSFLLPSNMKIKNWSRGAILDGVRVGNDDILFGGKLGILKYNPRKNEIYDDNEGIPKSIYKHKVNVFLKDSKEKTIYAGLSSGLYHRGFDSDTWSPVLDIAEDVRAIFKIKDQVVVITQGKAFIQRNGRFREADFTMEDEKTNTMSLIKYVFDLHNGKVLGLPGRLVMDIAGLFLIFFSVGGIFMTFFPSFKKIFRISPSGFWGVLLKFSYKHHIKWCLIIFVPIIIIALTGFFMRPPFVMLLAGKKINTKFHIHHPEADSWNNSIQYITIDSDRETILVFSGGKLYEGKWDFSERFKRIFKRLPLHPMGPTYFEYLGGGKYLIGSFSGLFIWNRLEGKFYEYFSNELVEKFSIRKTGPYQINGGMRIGNNFLVLDYHEGILDSSTGKPFLIMPEHFKEKSVFSLWHYLFEIHNGRFSKSFIGKWYILHNPVVALGTIIVMFTGLQILIKRKKRSKT